MQVVKTQKYGQDMLQAPSPVSFLCQPRPILPVGLKVAFCQEI